MVLSTLPFSENARVQLPALCEIREAPRDKVEEQGQKYTIKTGQICSSDFARWKFVLVEAKR